MRSGTSAGSERAWTRLRAGNISSPGRRILASDVHERHFQGMTTRFETAASREDRAGRNKPVRVLYSFPHKLGADRICYTAWNQVNGLAAAGADVLVFPGVLHKSLPKSVKIRPTLAWGNLRIHISFLAPSGPVRCTTTLCRAEFTSWWARSTSSTLGPSGRCEHSKRRQNSGIPTVLERPNAHTRFAYEVVQKECERLQLTMPPGHEHAYKADWLRLEEEEYHLADRLLCPSDFVAQTFLDRGFPPAKLGTPPIWF